MRLVLWKIEGGVVSALAALFVLWRWIVLGLLGVVAVNHQEPGTLLVLAVIAAFVLVADR